MKINFRIPSLLIFIILISGCGLTGGQKAQVQTFSKATSAAIDATSGKIIDVRSSIIDIRKERIILGDLSTNQPIDLDAALDPDKIAIIVAAMRLLKDYANALDALATNDQSEAIRKAVSNFSTSVESAAKTFSSGGSSLSLSKEQKEVAAGSKSRPVQDLSRTYAGGVARTSCAISRNL